MKTCQLVLGIALGLLAGGCGHVNEGNAGSGTVYSPRNAADQTELLAKKIYVDGQASSPSEARMKAAEQVNQNWATESRRVEKKRAEEKFTKELNELELPMKTN